MKKFSAIILMIIFSAFFLFLIQPKNSTIHIYDVFDTYSEITINSGDESILSECSDYLHRLDRLWSTTNQESEISILNSSENTTALSDETKDILKRSTDYSAKTNGYFDVTVGASSALWNDAIKQNSLPEQKEIELAAKEDKITLGAIAKGYASDKLTDFLTSKKITSAMINLGGNVYALGRQISGAAWKIGIQDPMNGNDVIGTVEVSDSAVVTSGSYIRYFDYGGRRYHHIIDPKTGEPSESGLLSVTIISPSATVADVLSTACFIAGLDEGIALIKEFDVMAIFVTESGEVYYSKELAFTPELNSYDYKIIN